MPHDKCCKHLPTLYGTSSFKLSTMKLRIREGSTTHRLQLEEGTTYEELRQLLGTKLGLLPDSIKLSLNKSVSLDTLPVGGSRRIQERPYIESSEQRCDVE